MAMIRLVLIAVLLVACGDANSGTSGSVVEAHVVRVVENGERTVPGVSGTQLFQRLEVQLDSSLFRGEHETIEWSGHPALDTAGLLRPGDRVLLSVVREGDKRTYQIQEVVRLPQLALLVVLLLVALFAIARLAGLAAIAGVAASVAVFLLALVPAVQRGGDPLVAVAVGACAAAAVAVFAAAGPGRAGIAALLGAVGGLVAVAGLGAAGLAAARMTGFTTEDASSLFAATGGGLDLARVALAGVIAASIGALVDVAVTQSRAVLDLAAADPGLRGRALYLSGVRAGRAHFGPLMGTLTFAFLGGTLPLVLLVFLDLQPRSATLNSAEMAAAVVTVLAASIGLVVCAPVTTAVAVALAGEGAGD